MISNELGSLIPKNEIISSLFFLLTTSMLQKIEQWTIRLDTNYKRNMTKNNNKSNFG